ncbi:ubiquitin carboxyl-terminal hydrolase 8 isoform X3, partial [Paramuricea clavata]
MRNLKQDDFPGRSRLRPDAFVLENYQRIRRRGNDYGDRIASKRGQKRKKSNERIESTRRDVKKQKVNGNKRKENKFEAKERREQFSKPATNPAVKVKDLSNSDEDAETEKNYSTKQKVNGNKKKKNKFEAKERREQFSKPATNPAVKVKDLSNSDEDAETEKNYSTVQETWGKKDALTPKQNPKISQFQQSPTMSLSKKNNERIESTRRDVKKQKVNGNKKKENKFEAKERREQFSKPATNPAVKVKDLSNSDEDAETEKNYSTVQETWGKKDPLTPKRNPKIGQFQQSPTIPLSKTPDVKKKNNLKKKPSSAFFNFLHSRGKKHRAAERRKIPELAKEAGELWRHLPQGDKDRFKETSEKEGTKVKEFQPGKIKNPSKKGHLNEMNRENGQSVQSKGERNVSYPSSNQYRGLINKANHCWMNCLVQCLNASNMKEFLFSLCSPTIHPLIDALVNTLKKLNGNNHQPYYPGKLYKSFINEFGYVQGRQYDIHESLTSLSSVSLSDNSKIADLFSGLHQYDKTCLNCYKRENIHAEKFFSFFIPLDQDITNLVDSLHDSLTDVVEMFCEVCNKQTHHFRNGYLLELPTTLVVTFKRFQIDEDQREKNHATVSLPRHFSLNAGENYRRYNLTSCALHYGQRIDCGHYTAVVFDENSVLEINDTVIKDVSSYWEDFVASTVYVAFYSVIKETTNDGRHSKHNKDDSGNSGKKDDAPKYRHTNENDCDECEQQGETCAQPENNNSSPNEEQIFRLWDVSNKDTKICTMTKDGYDLYGKDFKSLEYPLINKSYIVPNTGWLNDAVVDAYLTLLVKECAKNGTRYFAFNTQFITKLRCICSPRRQKEFHTMIS